MKAAGRVPAWGGAIAELVPDLALSLGAWAERVYALVGPLSAARPEPVGDPDGFDGLTRRGSYERLTPFEWLLADEAPDEFLRRAAAGEHAFWRLAYRGPAGSRRCVALLAGGAELLGAPRLVTLAALLALSRRAAEARAEFAWGFWGPGGPTLFERLEPDGVRQWLREGRALAGPSAPDVARFFDERARAALADDAWLLGGALPTDVARPPAFARLAVAHLPDLEGRRARVLLERPGAPPRALDLALPEPALSARWLRAPFVAPTAPPAPLRKAPPGARALPDVPPLFGPDGRRLFVRLEGGAVAAYVVPNSTAAPPTAPAVLSPRAGGHLLAVASQGKTHWAVEAYRQSLSLYRFGKRGGVGWERTFAPAPGVAPVDFGPVSLLAPCLLPCDGLPSAAGEPTLVAVVPAGDLLVDLLDNGHWRPRRRALVAAATDRRWRRSVVAYWDDAPDALLLEVLGKQRPGAAITEQGECPRDPSLAAGGAFFGELSQQACGFAFRAAGDLWWLVRWAQEAAAAPKFRRTELALPPASRVVGVTPWPSPDELALVTLDAAGRRFEYATPDARGPVAEAPARVVAAAFCPVARALAYHTADGLLVVRSLPTEQDVLRVGPAGGAP